MGTGCLTVMYDTSKSEIAVMYRQFDGYPEGHGQELADFLNGFEIVNGISEEREKMANGGGCLAAQIVAHFKDSVGGFYLHPAGTRECGEEYIYHVYPETGKGVSVKVEEL